MPAIRTRGWPRYGLRTRSSLLAGGSGGGGFVASSLRTNLAHRWPLDETSGTRADELGGAPLTDVNTVTSDLTGPFSKAAVFTQANAEELTAAGFVFPNNYTYSVWAYWNAADIAALATLVWCAGGFLNDSPLAAYGANAGIDQLNTWATSPYTNTGIASYWTNEWHLFTVTFDTDNMQRVYLDGVLLGTGSAITSPYRLAQTLRVGGTGAVTQYFGGKMAEVLLHSVVLTQAQIDEMYLAAKYHAQRVDATMAAPPTPTAEIFLTYGDSKTFNEYYQAPLQTMAGAYTPATGITYGPSFTGFSNGILARGGSTVASMKALVDADLATAGAGTPNRILSNLGANDASALPAQATWKADYAYILDAFHTKWPTARVYVMRAWRQGFNTECDSMATWIDEILVSRSAWAETGPDERVFLKSTDDGVRFTSDGVHPNLRGGALTGEMWLIDIKGI